MLSPARIRLPMNSTRCGGFLAVVIDEFDCCTLSGEPLLAQLTVLAPAAIHACCRSRNRIRFFLADQAKANAGHRPAPRLGNAISAFGAFGQRFALPEPRPGALDAVFDAGIDLLLNRPVPRPAAGHQCASAWSASAFVACRVPSACSGGA